MDGPQLGLLFGPPATYHEAHSAFPTAPVVVTRRRRTSQSRRPPVARTRRSVAGLLHHVADAISPAPAHPGGTATR
ncbi:hypothetical protein [Cellulomonas sp. URHD0024]|uniref:hypothetical protein n=1 Tax=Cellulomonas sp. URHD0024 TaxID=1302620 RepID=UPI00040CC50A|nr:hypothetical protein [Cellulomonas sp. URHD0024]